MIQHVKSAFLLFVTLFSFVPACLCCAIEIFEGEHHHHETGEIVSAFCFKNKDDVLHDLSDCKNHDKRKPCCLHSSIIADRNFQKGKEKKELKPISAGLSNENLCLISPKYRKKHSVFYIPIYQKERTLAELCRFII